MRPTKPSVRATRSNVDVGLQKYMVSIYQYMGLGLVLTGAIAVLLMYMPPETQMTIHSLSWLAMFGTLGIAIYFSFAAQKITVSTAQFLFWTFSALMGLSLTGILQAYTSVSIWKVVFITAGTFGAISVYASTTQRDLTSIGSFCMMGLFGLIIAGVVNIFMQSAAVDFVLSIIGVAVFVGLTAYDTQRLRQLYYSIPNGSDMKEKIAILGALSLYLDVINLFLSLLRLLGDRK